MNTEDVLVTYISEIANAEMAELPDYTDAKTTVGEAKYLAIRDLAAALRAEREESKVCTEELAENLLNQLARVSELEAILSQEEKRVAELETKCDRCGLKLAHSPTPGVTYDPPVLTCTPNVGVVYIPATVRYYPSETPGEPDVKEETYP